MTKDNFLMYADDVICSRVKDMSMRNYRKLMGYCENIYRECVGFNDNSLSGGNSADLICTGIVNAYIAGMEEPKQFLEVITA